jgi:RNA polymerase sigma factor (sigma-70 family)
MEIVREGIPKAIVRETIEQEFRKYLHTVRNNVRREIKRREHRRRMESLFKQVGDDQLRLLDTLEQLADGSLDAEIVQVVIDARTKLTPRENQVIDLLFNLDHTYDEAGKKLGVTKDRVKQLRRDVLTKLRTLLEPTLYPERVQPRLGVDENRR